MPDVTILLLSDLHIHAGDGGAPLARLAAVLADLPAMEPPPALAVIAGDLADRGEPSAYAALRAVLAAAPVPVLAVLGNHDDPAACDAAFGSRPAVLVAGGVTVLGLETQVPGRTGGALDPAALAALAAALEVAPGPAVIAMHHPPHARGAAAWEALTPESTAALAAAIAGRPVAAILCGHVHRDGVRLWNGVPVVTGIGLSSAIDPTRRAVLHVTEGAGFALIGVTDAGADIRFASLHPPRAERARVPVAGLTGG